jgi:adenine-specific DNA-methyltransferase
MPTLHWLSRDQDLTASSRVPYRLLEAVPELSYGDPATENMLIQGDNLDALKALLPVYAGRVKCIFIDPPYNTRSAFEHYDDNLEHAQWLSMMYPRLELLRDLLREDGSIWITIDDSEAHYLKVVGDEVFGRSNFVLDLSWRRRDGPPNDRKIASIHDHVLVWAKARVGTSKKTIAEEAFNLMPRSAKADAQYQIFTEPSGPDSRGAFRKIDTTANGKGGRYVESLFYGIVNPYTDEEVFPRKGTCWRHNRDDMQKLQAEGRLYWGVKGTAKTPMRKLFASEAKQGMSSPSIWDDVGFNQHASSEMEKLFGAKAAFETPKPESLLERILGMASNVGDLVLDSFLGSGTTAAVAHKMNRRYIGIEMGDHAATHVVPRLKKVIDGEQGGVSENLKWRGGGGFRFLRPGSAIFDEDGNINPKIKFAHLAAHVWFTETLTPMPKARRSPLLGVHAGVALYLLYNGILHDRRPDSGNVLTRAVLDALEPHDGPRTIYGESSRLSPATLKRLNITFKQTPYDVRAR